MTEESAFQIVAVGADTVGTPTTMSQTMQQFEMHPPKMRSRDICVDYRLPIGAATATNFISCAE